jgi:hypothetical protein
MNNKTQLEVNQNAIAFLREAANRIEQNQMDIAELSVGYEYEGSYADEVPTPSKLAGGTVKMIWKENNELYDIKVELGRMLREVRKMNKFMSGR